MLSISLLMIEVAHCQQHGILNLSDLSGNSERHSLGASIVINHHFDQEMWIAQATARRYDWFYALGN